MYAMILPVENARVFVEQIFRIFDKDGNGSIDFKVPNIQSRIRLFFAWNNIVTLLSFLNSFTVLGVYVGNRYDGVWFSRGKAEV